MYSQCARCRVAINGTTLAMGYAVLTLPPGGLPLVRSWCVSLQLVDARRALPTTSMLIGLGIWAHISRQTTSALPQPWVARRQVKELFLSNMTALGIPTITAAGESFHIDWINATDDRETLIEIATKSYLDWYMLTQVCTPHLQGPGPCPRYSKCWPAVTHALCAVEQELSLSLYAALRADGRTVAVHRRLRR